MAGKDYYKILGIDKSASKEEIKKAYKKLAKKYHPDINKEADASDKFKEVSEAAAVLGDDQKRQQYDQYGTTADQFQGGFQGFDFSDFFSDLGGGGNGGFDSIFETFFGGGFGGRSRRNGPKKGASLRYDMEVELEDVYHGVEKTIVIPRLEKCTSCDGSGAESSSDIETCPTCNGSGVVKRTQRTPFGMFSSTGSCPKCRGSGKFIKNECKTCDGTGLVKKTRKLKIQIPKGAETGTQLRMAGEGEAGEKGGPSGDLFIVIHVKENKNFERHGDDIYTKIDLPFTIAALGGEIKVPTIEGKADLKIPSGTQSNTSFRMRGKGIPHLRGSGFGDEYVEVIISVPKKLSKKQKSLLKDFEKEGKKKGLFKF